MKYMNIRNRFHMNLQFFAEGEGGADTGDDAGDGDDQSDDVDEADDDEPDDDEPKFTQADINKIIAKTIAKERRKAERKAQKGNDTNKGTDTDDDADAKVKAAEDKASKAEVKIACYEAGVSKDAIDDVVALARSYMAADEDLDLEDAIDKVVKKYPQFTGKGSDDDARKKSWGERQNGRGAKKLSGVEERFYDLNPDLRK